MTTYITQGKMQHAHWLLMMEGLKVGYLYWGIIIAFICVHNLSHSKAKKKNKRAIENHFRWWIKYLGSIWCFIMWKKAVIFFVGWGLQARSIFFRQFHCRNKCSICLLWPHVNYFGIYRPNYNLQTSKTWFCIVWTLCL